MAFLTLFLLVLYSCRNDEGESQEMKAKMDALVRKVETQEQRNDSLQTLLESCDRTSMQVYFGKTFDSIPNPEIFIKEALREQQELIPIDAVLGGNMEFRQVEILSEDWVMAIYDDGHVQGKSIFKYELQPNGELKFTELVSRLPDSP